MKRYEEITAISRNEAERVLLEGSAESIARTLLRLAYHESDWKWVQNTCITLAEHPDKWVRRTCVMCFSHIARIHGKIELEIVMPVLNRLLKDPEVRVEAEDVIKDFKVFLQ